MSYLSDPSNYDYAAGTGCSFCFPANQSPENVFVQVSGMLIGDDWSPGDPPAPNGLYELTYQSGCLWRASLGSVTVDWNAYSPSPSSRLLILVAGIPAFDQATLGPCERSYTNPFTSPVGRFYFGGEALVTNPLGNPAASPLGVMDLLSLDPADNYWVRPLPFSSSQAITGFYLKNGHTNCLVKYDLP